jgi:hypothetical protein
MKLILASSLALGIMSGALQAEPLELAESQMDGVTAGRLNWNRASSGLSIAAAVPNAAAFVDAGSTAVGGNALSFTTAQAKAFQIGNFAVAVSGGLSIAISGPAGQRGLGRNFGL